MFSAIQKLRSRVWPARRLRDSVSMNVGTSFFFPSVCLDSTRHFKGKYLRFAKVDHSTEENHRRESSLPLHI